VNDDAVNEYIEKMTQAEGIVLGSPVYFMDVTPEMKMETITGRTGPTPNRVSWKPLEGQLPMKHVVAGNRLGGAVALAVGLPWLYHAAGFLLEEIERTGFAFGQAFLILLVLGGLFVTLFGVSQFIYREKTVIDSETVRWSRHGLRGSKAWQEPLSRYLGVLKDYQHWSAHDSPGTSYTEYTLTLHHDEPSKRVRLYESQNSMAYPPDEWDRLWTHYARLFRLPVLESGLLRTRGISYFCIFL
jgi:multimeric flavodoxin WrbA